MKNPDLNIVILILYFFGLSNVIVVNAKKSQDPFYIIAHLANNRESLDWAVSQGANAIENDLQFDTNGNPTVFGHGDPCECNCAIKSHHICDGALARDCSASNNAVAHMQYVARLDGVALCFIDSKIEATWGSRLIKAGTAVIPFLDKNLFDYGYKGKVIINSATIDTYDYIQAAVIAANKSLNKDRYFFTFDQEDDNYEDVITMLSCLTNNRVYGTGTVSWLPNTFYTGIEKGVAGKNAGQHGMTYIWTIDKESSMKEYINRGVQGIMTNRVAIAKQIAVSMGLNLAKPSTNIPIATVSFRSSNKYDCNYHPDGCTISWPIPSKKACKRKYWGFWTCTESESLVFCDASNEKTDFDGY